MTAEVSDEPVVRASGGVQSLDRAFAILEAMADAGGVIGLSQLAEKADLPLATIHRLVRTLVDLGYVRQEDLAPVLPGPPADAARRTQRSKRMGAWTRPAMTAAVAKLGESVNLAVLDGDEIVYVAQVQPSANFMRMFTEVGFAYPPHATAVGKAILADYPDATSSPARAHRDAAVHRPHPDRRPGRLPGRAGRGASASATRSTTASRRSACAASPSSVPDAPQPMAMSMSGPLARVDDELIERAHRVLGEAADEIQQVLNTTGATT